MNPSQIEEAGPPPGESRRRFLKLGAAAGAGLLVPGTAGALRAGEEQGKKKEAEAEEDVNPAEDLMREHGVLKRVLLVYREAIRRLDSTEDLPPAPLADAAGVIRHFIEDYHEELEELYLFPRFKKAGKLVELVEVLYRQHEAGRTITLRVLQALKTPDLKNADNRKKMSQDLKNFVRMYEPHEAREDTVLFPALRSIVSRNEYDSLGEEFEKKEHERFGSDGFEKMVDRVAGIEKKLGIYDLAQFTPKA
jgi:hemerythrin-like domain-containing protein